MGSDRDGGRDVSYFPDLLFCLIPAGAAEARYVGINRQKVPGIAWLGSV